MLSYLAESRRLDNSRMPMNSGVTLRYPDLASGLAALRHAIGSAHGAATPVQALLFDLGGVLIDIDFERIPCQAVHSTLLTRIRRFCRRHRIPAA